MIVREYTREAGVRSLERRIADLCRKAARQGRRRATTRKLRVDEKRAREWLGPRRFAGEVRKRTSDPGVATGLAVTAVGGDVLFIEATAYPGNGRLIVTGQLGEVMQESAQRGALVGAQPRGAARRSTRTGSPTTTSTSTSLPARCRRTGPSAGITIATALVSLARGKPVSSDVAMTGEITLTGQVLQIGGVRDKVLAAQRAGVHKVILPRENEPDLVELPPQAREQLQFVLADTIEDVLGEAFDGAAKKPPRARASANGRARSRARAKSYAKLGLAGRLALVRAVEDGLSLKQAAACFSVSPATVHRWWHRWVDGGRQAQAFAGPVKPSASLAETVAARARGGDLCLSSQDRLGAAPGCWRDRLCSSNGLEGAPPGRSLAAFTTGTRADQPLRVALPR